MNHYTINQKGVEFIKDTLVKYSKAVSVSECMIAAYTASTENSANSGDSIAVHEIGRLYSIDGMPHAFCMDLDVFFDCKGTNDEVL